MSVSHPIQTPALRPLDPSAWFEKFDPDGVRKLWFSANGSTGQSELWALDIHEGKLGTDFEGRVWDVELRSPSEEREDQREATSSKAEMATKTDMDNEKRYLDALDNNDKGRGSHISASWKSPR